MRCITPGCGREVDRRWDRVCSHCQIQRRRQGSAWGKVVPAASLKKHRHAAYKLLKQLDPDRLEENGPDVFLASAFRTIKERMRTARGLSLASTPGKPAARQAEAFWARAREDNVQAHLLIADALAFVRMRHREGGMLNNRAYYETQVGKRAHRRAHSTEWKDFSTCRKENGVWVLKPIHKRIWVQTKGKSLRLIGRTLIDAVESAAHHHWDL